ncbi:type II toxin-antitoxin system VapB family antitoxin, partial [candidate division KSB1 bacterium]|nr:type II toxin-antitoxin system VapB family antitoxin [candidate division KSB1 bacterium]
MSSRVHGTPRGVSHPSRGNDSMGSICHCPVRDHLVTNGAWQSLPGNDPVQVLNLNQHRVYPLEIRNLPLNLPCFIHINMLYFVYRKRGGLLVVLRTNIELDEKLVKEAMKLTKR